MKTIAALPCRCSCCRCSGRWCAIGRDQQQVDAVGEPFTVLNAEKAWLGADAFWPLAKSGDPLIRDVRDPRHRPPRGSGQRARACSRSGRHRTVRSPPRPTPSLSRCRVSIRLAIRSSSRTSRAGFSALGDADAPRAPLLLSRPLAQHHLRRRGAVPCRGAPADEDQSTRRERSVQYLARQSRRRSASSRWLRLNPRVTGSGCDERAPADAGDGRGEANTAEVRGPAFARCSRAAFSPPTSRPTALSRRSRWTSQRKCSPAAAEAWTRITASRRSSTG